MVQMVGWPKDVSLDVDLDVEKIKSALKKYFLAKAEPTSSFWDVGAKRVDGTSQHPASCTGLPKSLAGANTWKNSGAAS